MNNSMTYRSDVDGLRALAVTSVILGHAGFEAFAGGFVGVDAFFVISGYLITRVLLQDLESGHINLASFYERRARRILPALYVMLIVLAPVATFVMLPAQLKDFGQSLIATVGFVSNIYFFLKTDYWSVEAEFLPLLHTWSLGVEEQFYIIFPLMLAAVMRLSHKRLLQVMVALLLASLIGSEYLWRSSSVANFFFMPTRAWEFLSGSAVALMTRDDPFKSNGPFALAGLLLFLFSILTFDRAIPTPSAYALLPVIGVLLILMFAGKETLAARLLSTRAFVGIGLISYSLYLYHQPIFALYRIQSFDKALSDFARVGLIATTIVLSVLSYFYVEKPFRTAALMSRRRLLAFSVVPILIFSGYGLLLHNTHGLKDAKLSNVGAQTRSALDKLEEERYERHIVWNRELQSASLPFGAGGKRSILILGDSISQDLYVAFKYSLNSERQWNVRQFTFDDECAKHLYTKGLEINQDGVRCKQALVDLTRSILLSQADTVIIAAAWLENAKYLAELVALPDLTKKRILIYKTHSFSEVTSQILAAGMINADLNDPKFQRFLYSSKHSRTLRANELLEATAKENGFKTLNGFDAFCDDEKHSCVLFSKAGSPFLIDQAHLSKAGAVFFQKWLLRKLEELGF